VVDDLTVKLKNAVMYHICKARIMKRIPNFNEILNMAIEKKKREMAAARRKQQEFDLETLGPEDTYLTQEQYELIKEQILKITQTLDDQNTKVESLKMKLFNLIKKNPHYQHI
jgi:predicted RNase H-like nuclease (RuvC/YqgF family)